MLRHAHEAMSVEQNPQMVNLTIDGKPVTVPKGTFVLTAARQAGIEIPTFCEYTDLRPFGACRMCQVELVTKRGSTVDISCSTPVSEGMQVFTHSPKVREAQRFVIEALLVDHPLDCPICDASGECDLQNNAYLAQARVDNPLRRPKQSWETEALSESVSIKRDRCVLCGRCVRVCDELVGSTALSWARRGFTSYIDAAFGEDLKQSPCVSCGLCIEVCPVGALLNTSYHDTARAWFLKHVDTVCTFCGVGCSMVLHVEESTGRIKRIEADNDTGINNRQLCARGFFGYEFVERDDRLRLPMVRKDGVLVETTWQEALDVVARGLSSHAGEGFGAIAGAHCTNEELYLFNKLVRGVMRSNNIDADSGYGLGVRRDGLRELFGSDAATNSMPDILENAGAVLVIGSNLSASHPVFSYKLQTAIRRREVRFIEASPYPTPLTQFADVFLRYEPGTEADLLNGLAALVAGRGLVAPDYIQQRVAGYDDWLAAVREFTLEKVSRRTGVAADDLLRAAELYATGGAGAEGRGDGGLFPPAAIIYSSGLTQQRGGEGIDYAAAALALVTGNVGRAGAGVNALKIANNSQGAVDMGCVPWGLPGEQPIEDSRARQMLEMAWGMEEPLAGVPGLGFREMVDAAATGRLRAMYIMGANPVEATPDVDRTRSALANLEFLVVQDVFLTPTGQLADVVLPACSWAEKDGTYTNMERRVQRVNKALTNVGQSIPDWTILVHVLNRMGYAVGYANTAEILREIASVVPNYVGINRELLEQPGPLTTLRPGKAYQNLAFDTINRLGVQWPLGEGQPHGTPVLYADGFPNGRARLIPPAYREGNRLGTDVYRATLAISLYEQGTNTLAGRCPTLRSLQMNGAADSSLERGRGVGIVRDPHLEVVSYNTGQVTAI